MALGASTSMHLFATNATVTTATSSGIPFLTIFVEVMTMIFVGIPAVITIWRIFF
jgi:hypothetical protein